MLAPQSQIQAHSTIRRKHALSLDGDVLVELGSLVKPHDVLARAKASRQHLMLDASRALAVPAKEVKDLMQRKIGERVEKGAIIAGRRRIAGRLLRAPVDGRILALSGGQLLMQVNDKATELLARIPGKVIEIDPNRGATIECHCAWIQGAWGNGQFAEGKLKMLTDDPRHALIVDEIDIEHRGLILVGGHCGQAGPLEMAQDLQIAGLVLGSISSSLNAVAEKMSYPIFLSEGFGKVAMNLKTFKLLESLAGEESTLNAQKADISEDVRPEILIPHAEVESSVTELKAQEFFSGQQVRVVREPHMGAVGEIGSLLAANTVFPSGIRAAAALVQLSDDSEVVVPLANLEVLV
jgi:hypothetical protein